MAVLLIAAIIAAIAAYLAFFSQKETTDAQEWEHAHSGATSSQVDRILLRVSRPLAATPIVRGLQGADASASPWYQTLSKHLVGSSAYGGSVEVFLSVQFLCLLIGAAALVVALIGTSDTVMRFALVAGGIGITSWPYNQISKASKKRSKAVTETLPAFAELLQMPISAGMGILPSLAFTAERLDGPVADEVRNLINAINSRALPETEAFRLAGQRVGTPAGQAFFTACMQAHFEQAKLADNLAQQANMLRNLAYQQAREDIKKLPIKLVVIMGVHLIIPLLAVAIIPSLLSLGNI